MSWPFLQSQNVQPIKDETNTLLCNAQNRLANDVFLQPRRFNSSGTQLQKPKNLHYKNGLLL
jgi:hypothetical protein